MDFETRIGIALLNRDITHSSFRLYAALAAALQGHGSGFAEIYVEGLKAEVPGVKGKPLGEGPLRENLRELERLDLIEMTGRKWSKHRIHVRLKELDGGRQALAELRTAVVVPPDAAWGPDSWRSPQ